MAIKITEFVSVEVILVTKDLAASWLEGQLHNRSIRDPHVADLILQLQSGMWVLTHQGVAFDETGALIDGQHRLWAVYLSGIPAQMLVFRGVPKAAQAVIDRNAVRTMRDIFIVDDTFADVTGDHLSILRRFVSGPTDSIIRLAGSHALQEFAKYKDAIQFAVDHLPKKTKDGSPVGLAPVRAAIARAWFSEDHARLEEFCRNLFECSPSESGNRAAILLFAWIQKASSKKQTAKFGGVVYRKTEYALRSYLDGKAIDKLAEAKREIFKLDDEAHLAALRTAKLVSEIRKRRKEAVSA